jgi:hypothetical protein
MLIVNHTLRFEPSGFGEEPAFVDSYQLCDTMDEARQIVTGLISRHENLHTYAISQVIESSEPHWVGSEIMELEN